uniref:Conserved plasma membrane protein n=1 Tax=Macrostomum lignano TaxID=282301 RepID=A0A1I8I7G2_9PLAT
ELANSTPSSLHEAQCWLPICQPCHQPQYCLLGDCDKACISGCIFGGSLFLLAACLTLTVWQLCCKEHNRDPELVPATCTTAASAAADVTSGTAAVGGSGKVQVTKYGSIRNEERKATYSDPHQVATSNGLRELNNSSDEASTGFSGFYLPASPVASSVASSTQ